MIDDGLIEEEHYYGTINCDGINADGDICGVTTTSGLGVEKYRAVWETRLFWGRGYGWTARLEPRARLGAARRISISFARF